MKTQLHTFALAIAVLGGLAACSPSDPDKTAGQQLDQAVASSEHRADDAKADVKQGAQQLKDAAMSTANAVKDGASDAAITTAVNGALVKDDQLSALKIDVDTHDGHVVLHGTAPDAASQQRATQLAQAVDGVQTVDNQLTIKH